MLDRDEVPQFGDDGMSDGEIHLAFTLSGTLFDEPAKVTFKSVSPNSLAWFMTKFISRTF
jgi:hypothetical protein